MRAAGQDGGGEVPGAHITVHVDVCVGAGQCVLAAPEIFDQGDEDGLVRLLEKNPSRELLTAAREAERHCPSGAVTVKDDSDV